MSNMTQSYRQMEWLRVSPAEDAGNVLGSLCRSSKYRKLHAIPKFTSDWSGQNGVLLPYEYRSYLGSCFILVIVQKCIHVVVIDELFLSYNNFLTGETIQVSCRSIPFIMESAYMIYILHFHLF